MTASLPIAPHERRKHSRRFLPLDVFVNNKGSRDDIQFDICEEGVCFRSTNRFLLNDFLFFYFIGQQESAIAEVKFSILGKVVWSSEQANGCYKYGAQFRFFNDPFSKQQKQCMLSAFHNYAEVG